MYTQKKPWLLVSLLTTSVALHASAWAAMGALPQRAREQGPRMVTVELLQPELPQLPPPPEPEPEPEERVQQPAAPVRAPQRPAPRRIQRRPARQQAPQPPPPTPAAEPEAVASAPVDLTGVTLTGGASGASWVSATGNGADMEGPIGPPGGRPRSAPAQATTPASSRPPRRPMARATDLSRPPRAPDLNSALARHYPNEARRRGVQGTALMRVRILANGNVGLVAVLSASAPSFGQACSRMLRQSRWSPPLDRRGRAVATEIRYNCRFRVR